MKEVGTFNGCLILSMTASTTANLRLIRDRLGEGNVLPLNKIKVCCVSVAVVVTVENSPDGGDENDPDDGDENNPSGGDDYEFFLKK